MYNLFYTYKSLCFYFLCIYLYRFIYIYIEIFIYSPLAFVLQWKGKKNYIYVNPFFSFYITNVFHKNISLYKKIWYSLTYSLFCSLLRFTGLLLFCFVCLVLTLFEGLAHLTEVLWGLWMLCLRDLLDWQKTNQRWTKKGNKGICNNLGWKMFARSKLR